MLDSSTSSFAVIRRMWSPASLLDHRALSWRCMLWRITWFATVRIEPVER